MTTTTSGALEILKQDSLGRVRTPWQRSEQLLDEYERSGMTGMAFAGYVGVKYHTFATWIQKRRKLRGVQNGNRERKGAAKAMRWVEAVEGEEAGGTGLVVKLGGGVHMEVMSRRGAELAAEVLRGMGVGRC